MLASTCTRRQVRFGVYDRHTLLPRLPHRATRGGRDAAAPANPGLRPGSGRLMGAKASVAVPIEPARPATDGRARGRHEVPPGWPLTKCTDDQAAAHERGSTPGGAAPGERG